MGLKCHKNGILPVILAGGYGTRLWPLSSRHCPKQFLALNGERTLLQETILRLAGLNETAAPLIICNEDHRFMVAEQLRQIEAKPAGIFLEPVGRNTAPAVALAALDALLHDTDPLLLVLPADHILKDLERFKSAIEIGSVLAEQGALLTFGIVPHRPETGFGYIRAGSALPEGGFVVDQFIEKPDLGTAEKYLADGGFYWNSGMFLFKASRFIEELNRYAPAIVTACKESLQGRQHDLDFTRFDEEAFCASPADSIDYALLEKTDRAVVVPLDAGWSDIGSWSALADVLAPDRDGNILQGDVLTVDCRQSFIHASSRLVAAIGLDDVCVVETRDAVLVTPKGRAQDVKRIIDQLKQQKRDESSLYRRVHRPWGAYESIDRGDKFQVKHLTIVPGGQLSLQKHQHRAEHWVVVSGVARITRGDEVFELKANESTYIPPETLHRLENCTELPLEIIEVQSGDYLGEDDIVRVDDIYGRNR